MKPSSTYLVEQLKPDERTALNRVETLLSDHEAISVVLDQWTGFYLDPDDT